MDDAPIAANVDACWAWRNIFVAATDAEAERIAVPAFETMQARRTEMRNRVYQEQGVSIVPMPAPGSAPPARAGHRTFAGLWFTSHCRRKAGRRRDHRSRWADHAVWPGTDVVRRYRAKPDPVSGKGNA